MQELKNIVSFQNDLIGKLNKKLKVFDEIVIEKNNLQKSVNEFEIWREKNDVFRKKVFDELMSSFEDQSEMLEKANCAKSDWQSKHNKLEDIHDCITDQFKSLKSQKNDLNFKLEDSEQNVKRLQKELRYTKSELEETNYIVGKLRANLNFYEIECCQKRKQLDEYSQVNNQLKEANCTFETDIKCTREKLQNAKLCASRMEEKWNLEREILSNELKTKCKTLHNLELQYAETNTTINEQACKIKALLTTLKDVKEAGLTKYEEMKHLVQKLQEEFTRKETNLCKLQNMNSQIKQDNELLVRELNSQKNKHKEIRER
ncbi:Hypothetical protein CINCED_3A025416 [Cinara cedri]|uniref:Uncharacterized protein n=1 Tax=Cinara cedri TaxID=506608 RepID=A0A5E4N0W7_9HEMI|nr:Hypothetical protein CINCED_3A025416 [Cinara cedri]